MTLETAHKLIIFLVATVSLESDTLLSAAEADHREPLAPVATYGNGRFRLGGWIDSLSFSPDGKQLASSSDRWGTAVWDVETGELIREFDVIDRDAYESTATFSPDGKLLVIAAKHLHVRDAATGELIDKIKNASRRVYDSKLVQFTRDGKHFLAYGKAGVLFIEAKTSRIVHKFELDGEWDRLNGLALAPDGSRAILGTYHLMKPIAEGRSTKATYIGKTWDLTSGKETLPRPPQDEFGSSLKYIQFSPDGRSLLLVTGRFRFQQTLKLLNPQTLKLQRVLPTTTGVVKSHAFTPDGKLLAVGVDTTRHYGIDLFDTATGELIRRWNAGRSEAGQGIKLAFSPDGKTIASSIERRPEITLWDTATGKERFPREEGSSSTIERIAILSDNRTLVTQDVKGRVIRRDLKTGQIAGEQVWPIPDSSMGLSCEATELLDSDLKRMAREPGLKDSKLLAEVAKHKSLLQEVRISADGNRVAVLFTPNRLSVYDRHTGKRLRKFGDKPKAVIPTTWYLTLSADGSHVVGNYGGNRHFWNVDTGEKVKGVPCRGEFAPDCTLMIYPGGDVRFWDLAEEKRISAVSDKPHKIGEVAFTPDGKFMASARYEENTDIVVWDFKTREVIRVLRGVRGSTRALCFSPDGKTLCASDSSTRLLVWDLSND